MAHKISRPQPWVPPSTAGTVFETTFPPTCDPPTTKVATGSRSNVEVIEGEGTMLIPSCSGALCSSTSGPIEVSFVFFFYFFYFYLINEFLIYLLRFLNYP